ncbi:MAG: phosphotransferase family protein [Candidatus Methylomirabilia bacterium]
MSEHAEVLGVEVAAVSSWIGHRVSSLTPPFTWTRLKGGHSNLTYRITDLHGNDAVVRRPPLGELLPTAHDMGREFRVISALAPTAVPVAPPIAFCEDSSVTGAPFYVMGLVDGKTLYTLDDTLAYVPEQRRGRLGESFIDVLTDLHSLDPDRIGLGDLGRRDQYVARQLHRWYASWNASREAAAIELPVVDRLHELLTARVPEQGAARVVHGDYGLHNCMVGPDHTIAAVLDWEISTLGDPLADLAYALNGWVEPGDAIATRDRAPTLAPGFPSRAQLLDRYASRIGRDVGNIDFYSTFNYWKTTCILQGVYARYVNAQKSAEGVDLKAMADLIRRCALLAEQAAASLS